MCTCIIYDMSTYYRLKTYIKRKKVILEHPYFNKIMIIV